MWHVFTSPLGRNLRNSHCHLRHDASLACGSLGAAAKDSAYMTASGFSSMTSRLLKVFQKTGGRTQEWRKGQKGTRKGNGGRGEEAKFFQLHELLVEFSLLGELEDEDDDDDEKFIPVSPGGFVAVFCPVKLFRHTGHVSCCSSQGTIQSLWNR